MDSRITNAMSESLSAKIQTVKASAKGSMNLLLSTGQ